MRQQVDFEAIRHAKARYVRGVDTNDAELVRGMLAEDCVLDYTDCFVDPSSGDDFFPAMSIIVRGRDAWRGGGLRDHGIVTVHQTFDFEIDVDGDAARSVCGMTDRLFMPEGSPDRVLVGYGHYHETWRRVEGAWRLHTLRLTRLKVETR